MGSEMCIRDSKFISDRMFSVPSGDWTDLLRLEAIIIKFSNNVKISGAQKVYTH